jgi:hypothetical protein
MRTQIVKTTQIHEERGDEEEFQFNGIPIAGESDGDSVESWESDIRGESKQKEDSLTQNHTWLSPVKGVNLRVTNDIASRIGPKKDGVIHGINHFPIPLHTNLYCPLLHITEDLPPQPFKPTLLTNRVSELHSLDCHGTMAMTTNAQRLAHTVRSEWRLQRRAINLHNKQHLATILDLQVDYINDPTLTKPPPNNPKPCFPHTPRTLIPNLSPQHIRDQPTLN